MNSNHHKQPFTLFSARNHAAQSLPLTTFLEIYNAKFQM